MAPTGATYGEYKVPSNNCIKICEMEVRIDFNGIEVKNDLKMWCEVFRGSISKAFRISAVDVFLHAL
jgi:hypothetical protein